MKSLERLVLHHQIGDGDGLGNRLVGHAAIPRPRNLRPRHATLQLFDDDPPISDEGGETAGKIIDGKIIEVGHCET